MTEVNSQPVKTEETKKIFAEEEIHEMFDNGFLSKLQQFAQRTQKDIYPEKNINCFMARMELKFVDIESPLTYESIIKDVNLQLIPVFQEEVDKSEAKSAAQKKLKKITDEAQAVYDDEIKRIDGEEKDLGDA